MSAYVFLGPSLPVAKASQLLPATYLPPVQQGDILRLLDQGPEAIGIIDGFFEVVPAVWHKEIMLALEAGVLVFGAASMGALRAAELQAFGMVGIGTIFEWYRSAVIECDDEVAVSHGPAELGYLPLSDALVDIRDACRAAADDGVVSPALAEELVATARALPFQERSYEAVLDRLAVRRPAAALQRWSAYCKSRGLGLKARDSILLLEHMRLALADRDPPPRASARVERTIFIERLYNEVRLDERCPGHGLASRDPSALMLGLTCGDAKAALLLRVLAREASERLGWQLSEAEVSEYAGRFCARVGLSDAADRGKWMRAHAISEEVFWRFINDSLLVQKLQRLHGHVIDVELPEQLAMMTAGNQREHTQ